MVPENSPKSSLSRIRENLISVACVYQRRVPSLSKKHREDYLALSNVVSLKKILYRLRPDQGDVYGQYTKKA